MLLCFIVRHPQVDHSPPTYPAIFLKKPSAIKSGEHNKCLFIFAVKRLSLTDPNALTWTDN
jgi:hypothetical protein